MLIKIEGKIYKMSVRRIKGELKLFFKTDDVVYNLRGFNFPHCRCSNRKHRLNCWKIFKRHISSGYYSGNLVLIPE